MQFLTVNAVNIWKNKLMEIFFNSAVINAAINKSIKEKRVTRKR